MMQLSKITLPLALAGAILASPNLAYAEATISVFGGANFSPHSDVTFDLGPGANIAPGTRGVGWDGASFEAPPYYGIRATWWFDSMPSWGIAAEFTHAKVEADPLPAGFSTLEFTDGINFLTINGLYRHQFENGLTPYVGVGAGLSIPHVEVDDGPGGAPRTYEYQVTGFAAQAFIGVDYKFTENWSVFGEYKFTYGDVNADLENGGSLDTDIISNQIILGISYSF